MIFGGKLVDPASARVSSSPASNLPRLIISAYIALASNSRRRNGKNSTSSMSVLRWVGALSRSFAKSTAPRLGSCSETPTRSRLKSRALQRHVTHVDDSFRESLQQCVEVLLDLVQHSPMVLTNACICFFVDVGWKAARCPYHVISCLQKGRSIIPSVRSTIIALDCLTPCRTCNHFVSHSVYFSDRRVEQPCQDSQRIPWLLGNGLESSVHALFSRLPHRYESQEQTQLLELTCSMASEVTSSMLLSYQIFSPRFSR